MRRVAKSGKGILAIVNLLVLVAMAGASLLSSGEGLFTFWREVFRGIWTQAGILAQWSQLFPSWLKGALEGPHGFGFLLVVASAHGVISAALGLSMLEEWPEYLLGVVILGVIAYPAWTFVVGAFILLVMSISLDKYAIVQLEPQHKKKPLYAVIGVWLIFLVVALPRAGAFGRKFGISPLMLSGGFIFLLLSGVLLVSLLLELRIRRVLVYSSPTLEVFWFGIVSSITLSVLLAIGTEGDPRLNYLFYSVSLGALLWVLTPIIHSIILKGEPLSLEVNPNKVGRYSKKAWRKLWITNIEKYFDRIKAWGPLDDKNQRLIVKSWTDGLYLVRFDDAVTIRVYPLKGVRMMGTKDLWFH